MSFLHHASRTPLACRAHGMLFDVALADAVLDAHRARCAHCQAVAARATAMTSVRSTPVPQGLLANLLEVAHTTEVDPAPLPDRLRDTRPTQAERGWNRAAVAAVAAAGVAGVVIGSVVAARRPRLAV